MEIEYLWARGVRLSDSYAYRYTEGNQIEVAGKNIVIRGLSEGNVALFKTLWKGLKPEDIQALGAEDQKFLDALARQGLLLPLLVDKSPFPDFLDRQLDWLSHFAKNPEGTQHLLSVRKVIILGCGGTGAIVAEHLLRAGITNFCLLDDGVVDAPDLNRQLAYTRRDIGFPKVDRLKLRLEDINPSVSIQVIKARIESKAFLEAILSKDSYDLAVHAYDTPSPQCSRWSLESCRDSQTPLLMGGVGVRDFSVGPLLHKAESLEKHIADLSFQESFDAPPPKGSISFSNSICAVSMAFRAFRFLSNLDTAEMEKVVVKEAGLAF